MSEPTGSARTGADPSNALSKDLSNAPSRDLSVVALAVTEGMRQFELSVAYEVFGPPPSAVTGPWYDVSLCGPAD
ncbi:hypothetical protein ACWCQ0_45195, partial [Streptomyces massasporeus]